MKMKRLSIVMALAALVSVALVACAGETKIVERITTVEVVKEVPVEVIKEVEVERIVTVEVEKIVEIEREVVVEREKLVEVEKVLIATPTAPAITGGPVFGGTLRIASQGSISTLDPVFTQFATNNAVAQNMFDRLFGWGEDFQPLPQMVDNWDVSPDGKTYTFNLREDLLFWDLTPVTAEDVAVSFERWLPSTFPYATMMANFAADPWTTVVDDDTFRLNMAAPFGAVLDGIAPAHKVPMVMPARLSRTPFTEAVPEWMGSGPYKFAEWNPGDRVILERFEEYVSRTDKANWLGGEQIAYLDRLMWLEIPDQETKVTGLETGEWDIAQGAGLDFFSRLDPNPDISVRKKSPGNRNNIMLNPWKFPFGSDESEAEEGFIMSERAVKMRQAVMYGVDIEKVMFTLGPRDLWILCSGYYYCGTPKGDDTDVGDQYYNINDKDMARRMLAEAGYNGETILVMTPNDYATITPIGQFMKQEMEDMGFVVEQPNRDWATVVTIFTTKEGWDANASWSGWGVTSDPINDEQAAGQTAFWPTIPKVQELRLAWAKEVDPAKKRAIRMEIETLLYERVIVVGLGIHFQIEPHTVDLKNLIVKSTLTYANTWLDR